MNGNTFRFLNASDLIHVTMLGRLGHIEMWNTNATQCRQKVPPLFNRLVIFTSTDEAFHGHPEPLDSPANQTRIGFQLVLFSKTPPTPQERFATTFEDKVAGSRDSEIEEVSVDADVVPGQAEALARHNFHNYSTNDPSWFRRKVYKSPHSAVFQVPCNSESMKAYCEKLAMPLTEPRHCECNHDGTFAMEQTSSNP
jgi:hypothetical protein